MKKLLLTALLICSPLAMAEESLPDFTESDPAITIRHDDDTTYYEYRINGELKEIKVVPKIGAPYYLVPAKDGFNRQEDSSMLVPKWVIFRW